MERDVALPMGPIYGNCHDNNIIIKNRVLFLLLLFIYISFLGHISGEKTGREGNKLVQSTEEAQWFILGDVCIR